MWPAHAHQPLPSAVVIAAVVGMHDDGGWGHSDISSDRARRSDHAARQQGRKSKPNQKLGKTRHNPILDCVCLSDQTREDSPRLTRTAAPPGPKVTDKATYPEAAARPRFSSGPQ